MVILRYIGSRLLFLVPQIVGIVLVGFILIKAVPGDPATLMLGPMASTDSIARLRTDLGLDQPLPVQFLIYLQRILQLESYHLLRNSAEEILCGIKAIAKHVAHFTVPFRTHLDSGEYWQSFLGS